MSYFLIYLGNMLCGLPRELVNIILSYDPKCYGALYCVNKQLHQTAQKIDAWSLFTRCRYKTYNAGPVPGRGDIRVQEYNCEIADTGVLHGFQKTLRKHILDNGGMISCVITYTYIKYGCIQHSREMLYKYVNNVRRIRYLVRKTKRYSNGRYVRKMYNSTGLIARTYHSKDGREIDTHGQTVAFVCISVIVILALGAWFVNKT